MSEEARYDYIKDNDYTLSEVKWSGLDEPFGSSYVKSNNKITRTFNFLSGQVTITCKDYVKGYDNNSVSVSNEMNVQNFRDIQFPQEIIYMRKKLVELGGNPPELKELDFRQGLQKPLSVKTPPQLNASK